MERTLASDEKVILDALLAFDFLSSEELRQQAETAKVVGQCACSCASVELTVDRHMSTRSTATSHPGSGAGP
jgi:hypothetical protein